MESQKLDEYVYAWDETPSSFICGCIILMLAHHFGFFDNLKNKKDIDMRTCDYFGLLAKAIIHSWHVTLHDQECSPWHLNSTPITFPRGLNPKKKKHKARWHRVGGELRP